MLKTAELSKQFTIYNLRTTINNSQSVQSFCSISLSVLQFVVFVYIKKPLTSIRIERGALQYVIKPFLYCDLFKASARAEKEKRKTFVFKEKLRTRIVQLISINVNVNVYFNIYSNIINH